MERANCRGGQNTEKYAKSLDRVRPDDDTGLFNFLRKNLKKRKRVSKWRTGTRGIIIQSSIVKPAINRGTSLRYHKKRGGKEKITTKVWGGRIRGVLLQSGGLALADCMAMVLTQFQLTYEQDGREKINPYRARTRNRGRIQRRGRSNGNKKLSSRLQYW